MEQIVTAIENTNGRIFRVTFVKRTTGDNRIMVCRLGVKRHLRGGNAAYDFREKNLIPVFDVQKGEYRSIPLDGIISATIDGIIYKNKKRAHI